MNITYAFFAGDLCLLVNDQTDILRVLRMHFEPCLTDTDRVIFMIHILEFFCKAGSIY